MVTAQKQNEKNIPTNRRPPIRVDRLCSSDTEEQHPISIHAEWHHQQQERGFEDVRHRIRYHFGQWRYCEGLCEQQ